MRIEIMPSRFTVDQLPLVHPHFPAALNGFRILFISDIHAPSRGRVRRNLVRFLSRRANQYDLILFGGDYQFGLRKPSVKTIESAAAVLSAARARHGVYACVGNHDHPVLIEELRARTNVTIAENGSFSILPDLAIAIVGDAWDGLDDIETAWKGIEPGSFVIVLSHSPDIAARAARRGGHLLICGHTHGGQVRLPFFGSPITRVRLHPKLVRGDFLIEEMLVHVTEGFGVSLLPVRIGTRCSIAEITLERGPLERNRVEILEL